VIEGAGSSSEESKPASSPREQISTGLAKQLTATVCTERIAMQVNSLSTFCTRKWWAADAQMAWSFSPISQCFRGSISFLPFSQANNYIFYRHTRQGILKRSTFSFSAPTLVPRNVPSSAAA
jgi:hypothetical protein